MNIRTLRRLDRLASRAEAFAHRAQRLAGIIRELPQRLPAAQVARPVRIRSEHDGHIEITLAGRDMRIYVDLEVQLADPHLRILVSGARGGADTTLLVPTTNRSLQRALAAMRRFLEETPARPRRLPI
jgi:hypothetical protein